MGWATRGQSQVLLIARPSGPPSSQQLAGPRVAQEPAARDRQTAALRETQAAAAGAPGKQVGPSMACLSAPCCWEGLP